MSQRTLPDPFWSDGNRRCLRCGYSLSGLAAPGTCPECGTLYSARQLHISGVPNSNKSMPIGRRLAWAGTIGGAVFVSFFWGVLLMYNYVYLIAAIVIVGGATAWLWITGPRERAGVEVFVFTQEGVARTASRPDESRNELDSVFAPWGDTNAVQLKRVSPFWRRLKIGVADKNGRLRKVILDAGIRCPDVMAADVEQVIKDLVRDHLGISHRAAAQPATPTDEAAGPATPAS